MDIVDIVRPAMSQECSHGEQLKSCLQVWGKLYLRNVLDRFEKSIFIDFQLSRPWWQKEDLPSIRPTPAELLMALTQHHVEIVKDQPVTNFKDVMID